MNLVEADTVRSPTPLGWVATLAQQRRAPWTVGALGAVFVLAAAVRWWGLDARSLWFDEAYSVFIARQPLLEIPRLLSTYDTHPPLHYVLLHVWMTLFGSTEVAVRLPSVLASLGVVVLTFLLGRRLAGDRVAVLAALLIALSPFQILSAQEARMYPFLTLFGLGAAYALWLAIEEDKPRYWIAYAMCTVLALYTHHFALLLLLFQASYMLAFRRRDPILRRWLRWTAVVALAYLPLLPMLIEQVRVARGWPLIRPPFNVGALTDTLGMFSFGGGLFGMGTYFRRGLLPLEYRAAVLLPFILLAACGVAGLEERRRQVFAAAYWLLPVATVALISLRWNIFYERYFSFVLPPFVVLLAVGVFYLADTLRRPPRSAVLGGVMTLLLSFTLPALADVYRTPSAYNWRGAAAHVTAEVSANDFILYVPAFARIPFEYYFQGSQARMGLNPREALPGGPPAARQDSLRNLLQPGRLEALARAHPQLWIVATIPIGYEARARIGEILAHFFREVEGKTFGQVFIFRWESRLYPKKVGGPTNSR